MKLKLAYYGSQKVIAMYYGLHRVVMDGFLRFYYNLADEVLLGNDIFGVSSATVPSMLTENEPLFLSRVEGISSTAAPLMILANGTVMSIMTGIQGKTLPNVVFGDTAPCESTDVRLSHPLGGIIASNAGVLSSANVTSKIIADGFTSDTMAVDESTAWRIIKTLKAQGVGSLVVEEASKGVDIGIQPAIYCGRIIGSFGLGNDVTVVPCIAIFSLGLCGKAVALGVRTVARNVNGNLLLGGKGLGSNVTVVPDMGIGSITLGGQGFGRDVGVVPDIAKGALSLGGVGYAHNVGVIPDAAFAALTLGGKGIGVNVIVVPNMGIGSVALGGKGVASNVAVIYDMASCDATLGGKGYAHNVGVVHDVGAGAIYFGSKGYAHNVPVVPDSAPCSATLGGKGFGRDVETTPATASARICPGAKTELIETKPIKEGVSDPLIARSSAALIETTALKESIKGKANAGESSKLIEAEALKAKSADSVSVELHGKPIFANMNHVSDADLFTAREAISVKVAMPNAMLCADLLRANGAAEGDIEWVDHDTTPWATLENGILKIRRSRAATLTDGILHIT